MVLFRPGSTGPVTVSHTRSKIGQTALGLSYMATASDLATSGNWTCQISNDTLVKLDFDTELAYISPFPLQAATFDILLLEVLIRELAADAGFHLHLQSSHDPSDVSSYLGWSESLARVLNGQRQAALHVEDARVELDTLDIPDYLIPVTDPTLPDFVYFQFALDAPSFVSPIFNSSLAAFETSLVFGPTTMPCVGHEWLDIRVERLSAVLDIGLDGTVVATCEAQAHPRAQGHDLPVDLSDDIASGLKSALESHFTRRQMRQLLEKLFVSLMRLNDTPPSPNQLTPFKAEAHVDSFVVHGSELIVRFYSVPEHSIVFNGAVIQP